MLLIIILYRYNDILDTLYDAIVNDIQSEEFSVSEKYKAKQEELGKNLSISFSFHPTFAFFFINFLYTNPLLKEKERLKF